MIILQTSSYDIEKAKSYIARWTFQSTWHFNSLADFSLIHCFNLSGRHPDICYNKCAKTGHTHINHCLLTGTHLYSYVNWSNAFLDFSIAAHISNPDSLSRETTSLPRAIALDNNRYTYINYQLLLLLLIIVVQLYFNISDVLTKHTYFIKIT